MNGHPCEIVVRREQFELVPNAQLRNDRIDGANLQARASTTVAQLGRFDVIASIERQKGQCCESVDDFLARPRSAETLEQLLQDKARRKHDIGALECVSKSAHFGLRPWSITPECEQPYAGVDEQAHPRERSAL